MGKRIRTIETGLEADITAIAAVTMGPKAALPLSDSPPYHHIWTYNPRFYSHRLFSRSGRRMETSLSSTSSFVASI